MTIKYIAVACAAIAATGCSTIVNGSNQMLSMSAADASGVAVDGANCVATGGSEFSLNETFVTPAEVKVPRSKKPIDIRCTKGAMVGETTIRGKVEGSTAGNIIAGGGIGVGVDALTGAIYKYPKNVLVTMGPAGAAASMAK